MPTPRGMLGAAAERQLGDSGELNLRGVAAEQVMPMLYAKLQTSSPGGPRQLWRQWKSMKPGRGLDLNLTEFRRSLRAMNISLADDVIDEVFHRAAGNSGTMSFQQFRAALIGGSTTDETPILEAMAQRRAENGGDNVSKRRMENVVEARDVMPMLHQKLSECSAGGPRQIWNQWRLMKPDRGLHLGLQEFRAGLRAMNIALSDREADALFYKASGGDSQLSFQDFRDAVMQVPAVGARGGLERPVVDVMHERRDKEVREDIRRDEVVSDEKVMPMLHQKLQNLTKAGPSQLWRQWKVVKPGHGLTLTLEEFRQSLRGMNIDMTDAAVEQLFDRYCNRNGELTFEGFQSAVLLAGRQVPGLQGGDEVPLVHHMDKFREQYEEKGRANQMAMAKHYNDMFGSSARSARGTSFDRRFKDDESGISKRMQQLGLATARRHK